MDADVIVVGAGLAGLVATAELVAAGQRVLLLDQENEANLGGQAFWSFGGLFLVDSPEQRRMRVRDSFDLAWADWQRTAGFDRDREDTWPRQWARAYVEFAAGEKRSWLREQGIGIFPVVGWAERRAADTPAGEARSGNTVPRFHITWGTGPGVVAPFAAKVRAAAARGQVELRFRHRVDALTLDGGSVGGVSGVVLEPSATARGVTSSRTPSADFALSARAVVVTSGGIGGNHDLVRANWPARMGTPPDSMLTGVPAHVDGRMLGITEAAGGNIVNRDRMWHYTEGITNYDPVWPGHGIRILPGPSSLWLDATGKRLPAPFHPGFDSLGTLEHIMTTGHPYTWFVLTSRIIEKEFALSGSEQNPDLTNKSVRQLLSRILPGPPGPVQAFVDRGADFVTATDLETLVVRMNTLTDAPPLDPAAVRAVVEARDAAMLAGGGDLQVDAVLAARKYLGDKVVRVASPHALLDPKAGPLIAVKLHVLTRKTLGGLETDLSGRVLRADGSVLPGLYAAGEVAGFGGGGMHGYRSLEGTFLGGCLFSGRTAGRALAAVL